MMVRACPPPPHKPRLRDSRDPRTLQIALDVVRAAIEEDCQATQQQPDMHACSLPSLLRGLPRHLLLPVFNAYCEWAASHTKEQGEPFLSLSEAGPPVMEPFLLQLLGLPEEQAASVQAWRRLADETAANPELQELLTEHFHNPAAFSHVARKLAF